MSVIMIDQNFDTKSDAAWSVIEQTPIVVNNYLKLTFLKNGFVRIASEDKDLLHKTTSLEETLALCIIKKEIEIIELKKKYLPWYNISFSTH